MKGHVSHDSPGLVHGFAGAYSAPMNDLTRVVIKNVQWEPGQVLNDGSGRVAIRCSAFTPGDGAAIESVWLDLRHTGRCEQVELAPVPGRSLRGSAEGEWRGTLHVPALFDTGHVQLPLWARDSHGRLGRAKIDLQIVYARPARTPAAGAPAFLRSLEILTGARLSSANRIDVLDNGAAAMAERLRLVKTARRSIDLQTYTLGRSELITPLIDTLVERAREGLAVRVVLNADTQLPTSPLSVLRLKLAALRRDLALEGSGPSVGEADRLPASWPKESGLALCLFNGRKLAELKACAKRGPPPEQAQWLTRLQNAEAGAVRLDELDRANGPGGLPALPLLDWAVHEKILIADGARAIVGGRNLEDPYFTNFRDVDLRLEGPVVREVAAVFDRTFDECSEASGSNPGRSRRRPRRKSQAETTGVPALFTASRPWNNECGPLLALVHGLQACQSRFWASSQYLILPNGLLRDALQEAAGRGVDVRILINSRRTSSAVHFGVGYLMSLASVRGLLSAGVRVFEQAGLPNPEAPQPYLHAKEFLLDTDLVAFGSFNLSLRSSYIESEDLLFLRDRVLNAARAQRFEAILAREAYELTPEKLRALEAEFGKRIALARHLELLF